MLTTMSSFDETEPLDGINDKVWSDSDSDEDTHASKH